jgi:hypothetical protein
MGPKGFKRIDLDGGGYTYTQDYEHGYTATQDSAWEPEKRPAWWRRIWRWVTKLLKTLRDGIKETYHKAF